MRLLLLSPVLMLLLPACSLLDFAAPRSPVAVTLPGPDLAAMADQLPAPLTAAETTAAPALADLLAQYRAVADDPHLAPALAQPLARRLADLAMLQADQQIADGADVAIYSTVLAGYRALLADAQDPSAVHYQLARALDLLGDSAGATEHLEVVVAQAADPQRVLEARFRRAELAFSAGAWRDAAADYQQVAAVPSRWQQHAAYMAGWALFKAGDPAAALPVLLELLAQLAPTGEASALAGQERLQDSLRATVLVLVELDGVADLAKALAPFRQPAWQDKVYAALADWYTEHERWQDSANTWLVMAAENPLHPQAPGLLLQAMATLRDAGFAARAGALQARFVESFAAGSAWFAAHGATGLAPWRDRWAAAADEQTRRAHARALEQGGKDNWLAAAEGYRQQLDTLGPNGDLGFLLGETLAEGGATRAAVVAWQQLVAAQPGHRRAADAGYGVVQLLAKAGAAVHEQASAAQAFATGYRNDPRAGAMQVHSAGLHFAAGALPAAQTAALAALDTFALAAAEQRTAREIVAHSAFALGAFALAEQHLALLLQAPGAAQAAAEVLRQRLLASLQQQAKAAEAAGDPDAAAAHLLRIGQHLPEHPAATAAAHDAATLLASGSPEAAIALLEDLRVQHPGHALSATVPARLAALHERLGNLPAAALELEQLPGDAETRRAARYRAAELWLAAGDRHTAIDRFRAYAHSHPAPVALQLEAMHQLDRLYLATGERKKRRFWLRKLLARHQGLGAAATQRSRWLAADAAWVLAEDAVAAAAAVPLAAPLAETLPLRQAAVQQAIAALDTVVALAVAPQAGAATLATAGVYRQLAADLLAAPVPQGLNPLEQEQYRFLLEEQAWPFEEDAIALYQGLVGQARAAGEFDATARAALAHLATLVPGRWYRPDLEVDHVAHL